ncbi:MAG: hypothetical protein IJE54_04085 [Peptococcaceae bacterium]|nr:hypothetical protein [Peptococcaceae bacterium]
MSICIRIFVRNLCKKQASTQMMLSFCAKACGRCYPF